MLKIEIDKSKFCDTKSIAKEISSFGVVQVAVSQVEWITIELSL